MSRTLKTKLPTVTDLFTDDAGARLADKNDPFRNLLTNRLKLKPACPSRRYASTLKSQPKPSACPPLPVLKTALSSGAPKSATKTCRRLTPVRVTKRFSSKHLSMPGESYSVRQQTPNFSKVSSVMYDDLSCISTDPSSNENSPGKEMKKPRLLDMQELQGFCATFRP
mmetsp:Transcript_29227/g.52213  ORF Transcript_29227/g.52213 Transcript_29227/m.52213 type:complete len:168 (+) Transcript_29227:268-771(+)|eukprot:CAMPEP_0204916054 /NCGR_PEP_ID=MMETSP1397-20131031/13962_1 /ASSEMBLY_ACC=CAM_ASM_000891 /TAXON_ID=49980 /ORGANISM="Climacostomum Climacostomum virens, Strain Stock W-24" /LENGTH=167 /DNA_ID=CAMNT_0052088407 /DNA_START=154 /DNA_END=657 /DNA_ORIENTATION=-